MKQEVLHLIAKYNSLTNEVDYDIHLAEGISLYDVLDMLEHLKANTEALLGEPV